MKNSENTPPATSRIAWLLSVAVFGYLWFVLINQLRLEWAFYPQYSYGWAVPFLCAYLIWQKVTDHRLRTKDHRPPCPVKCVWPVESTPYSSGRATSLGSFQLLFALLAFLYLPVRLIQAANPVWSLVSWGLALVVIGLTLCVLRLALPSPPWGAVGRNSSLAGAGEDVHWTGEGRQERTNTEVSFPRFRFSDFIFPICFFFVAVPWPNYFEDIFIQWLTRMDTRATVELVGWLGIPALPHGNVIEVATGMVGISDACSGIRSFQATLMISLFLGELYRLSVGRRAVLCLGGFAMSFLFNLVRMSLLVWVASSRGIAAIANWHDPAGVTILVACFCGLWAFAVLLCHRTMQNSPESGSSPPHEPRSAGVPPAGWPGVSPGDETGGETPPALAAGDGRATFTPVQGFNARNSIPGYSPPAWRLLVCLALWILLTEIGVASWYGIHEAHLPPAQQWTISWPTNNPTFQDQPIEADALQMLKCDENRRAGWQEDGRQWQAIFIQWNQGTRVQLGHSPNICMTAAGHTLTTITNNEWFDVNGLRLPFTGFEVMDTPQPFYIYYCLWNDRFNTSGSGDAYLSLCGNRLAPVLAGLRYAGQRSLELAVGGVNNAGEAETAVRAELEKILVVTTPPPP